MKVFFAALLSLTAIARADMVDYVRHPAIVCASNEYLQYLTSNAKATCAVPAGGGGGSVTNVTASPPLISSGGATPNITETQADATHSGYLTLTDWGRFNDAVVKTPTADQIIATPGYDLVIDGGAVVDGNTQVSRFFVTQGGTSDPGTNEMEYKAQVTDGSGNFNQIDVDFYSEQVTGDDMEFAQILAHEKSGTTENVAKAEVHGGVGVKLANEYTDSVGPVDNVASFQVKADAAGGHISVVGGVIIGSPTGGDKGANTLNSAAGVYDNGTRLLNPATTTSQAHQFFDGYNSITGAFTSAQPDNVTGNAATATALAANGANCSAGNYPLGVDASGNAESCTAVPTALPPSGAAGGDLTGTYPNPTVTSTANFKTQVETVRLDQMAAPTASVGLNSQKITSLANGSAASDAAAFGQIPTALPPNGSAGGDLSGTYPNPTVAKVNGNAPTTTAVANKFCSAIDSSARCTLTQPSASNLSDGTTGSGAVVLAGSPGLTGTPTAPTAAAGDRTTTLATTAFVQALFDTENFKPAAYAATTTTLPAYTYTNGVAGVGATIAFTGNGPYTTDGVTLALLQTVLVKNETGGNAPNNGEYYVSTLGVASVSPTILTRILDMDTPGEFTNALVPILNGTTLAGQTWQQTATVTTIGTSNVTFAVYSGAPVTITLTGDTTGSGTGSFATTTGKVNGVTYPVSPSTNTVPVVTSSNTITYEAVPNTALANSAITIGGMSTSLGGTVLGNVTNDAQTKAAVVPNTAPSAGQIFAGNAGGTAYAPVTVSGSGATITMSSAGVETISAIGNASLSNSSMTIAGHSVSLGGTQAIACADMSDSSIYCTATGANNAQTATYQVLAADFTNLKTITVASGTFTITLIASGSQPANGKYINVLNYGSGVVTIARSGQNINGAAGNFTLSAGSATAPTSTQIFSDGTNYFASIDEATLGTLTSVATTSPITGGTITGTGTIACATCATTTNGGALSGTAPIAVSAGGVISGGGLGSVTGALKGNGSGTITQAACADLSNGAASCSTDTTQAGNISGGTLPTGRMPALTGDATTSAGAVATTVKQAHWNETAITNSSSPYSVAATDMTITCDATAGAVTINLPAATGTGRALVVKKIDSTANACTPTRAGSDTIDGATSYSLTTQYAASALTDTASATWARTHVNQLGGDLSGISTNATVAKVNGNAPTTAAVANNFCSAVDSSARCTLTRQTCANISDSATGCSTTVGTSATVNTGTSGATIPLLNGVNTYSGASTFSAAVTDSVAGAASTPGLSVTGVPFAGTGTTSFPQLYVNSNTATASTTMATGGTALGVNAHSTNTPDLMNLMLDGVSRVQITNKGHINLAGTAPTCAFSTGGGTSPSCAMETGSTDNAGTMTLTTGTGSPGSTGTVTLTFNAANGTNSPVCIAGLTSGASAWSVNSSVNVTTQSTTAPVFSWASASAIAAVALTASTNYKMTYICIGK